MNGGQKAVGCASTRTVVAHAVVDLDVDVADLRRWRAGAAHDRPGAHPAPGLQRRPSARTRRRRSTQVNIAENDARSAAGPWSGGRLYDELYRLGYHSNLNTTHAGVLVSAVIDDRDVSTVLDYGCSHGHAVQALWEHGINASGYDVSTRAVEIATRVREKNRRCVDELGFCFSATLPRAPPQPLVDAVLSSDVLEHVEPDAVESTLALLARLARRKLYLKIASIAEKNKKELLKLDPRHRPQKLHATIRSFAWWSEKLARHGFVKCRSLEATGLGGDSAVFCRANSESAGT